MFNFQSIDPSDNIKIQMHKCYVPNCSYATYESVANAVLRASLIFPISTFFVLLIYCKESLLTDMAQTVVQS